MSLLELVRPGGKGGGGESPSFSRHFPLSLTAGLCSVDNGKDLSNRCPLGTAVSVGSGYGLSKRRSFATAGAVSVGSG